MYKRPDYSYRSITREDKEFGENMERLSLKELRRLDNFNITKWTAETEDEFIHETYGKYLEDLVSDAKDYICNRFYFKEFVIREAYNVPQFGKEYRSTLFFHFKLSDWNEEDKINGIDSRCLYISIYQFHQATNNFTFEGSYLIKARHKDQLYSDLRFLLGDTKNNINHTGLLDKGIYDKFNFYVIPLYAIAVDKKYKRVSELAKVESFDTMNRLIQLFIHALMRFIIFNYWILNTVEENKSIEVREEDGSIKTFDTLTTCIKNKAKNDKKIVINVSKDATLRMGKNVNNIYDHYQKKIIKLCDYKFQVCAHYESYWCGSRKDGTRHKELRWKEAYYKNKDKEYNIIKEYVDNKKEGNK